MSVRPSPTAPLPTIDFANPHIPDLRDITSTLGCFYARHPLFPAARCLEALELARSFFALPLAAKQQIAIERSPHFRGYSQMHNERDCREQIHFGREEPAPGSAPRFQQLRGENLWPGDASWRQRMLTLLADLERAGRDILAALACTLHLAPNAFLAEDELPYVLLKLIHYPVTDVPQSGVAPHVDFSWITLVLQDGTGGLEIRTPSGEWIPVPSRPGTLVINTGEILQFCTGGTYQATPHRVTNRSRTQSRLSLPFFLNPSLTRLIEPLQATPQLWTDADHVHRVLQSIETPFLFGEAEWRRKGLGVWCASCVTASEYGSSSPTPPRPDAD